MLAFGPQANANFRLPMSEIAILDSASKAADSIWSGQTREGSFKHAMRGWFQSPSEAKGKAEIWLRYCLNLAADLNRGGSRIAALHRLGLGMHTIADSYSPTHVGFQAWGGDEPLNIPGAIRHHIREKPSGNTLKDAASALQAYYQQFRELSARPR
jgi:hypothetical protein